MNRDLEAVVNEYGLDPESMTRVQRMRLAEEALREKIQRLEYAIERIQDRRLEIAAKALGRTMDDIETPFVHECDGADNPIEHCVYDGIDDPAWDDCLFCHQPYERK